MEEAEILGSSGGSKKNWKQHSLNSPARYQIISEKVKYKHLSGDCRGEQARIA